ncbi:VOC family protein [Nostoc sp. NZL]|uniref:VOC family protein n=1 Tax=Nostoc sp. NZL TaxID=2650612 RepID=UPI0018C59713|nr:VOC family protein [Nostoc sp. NZL]
MSIKKNSNSLFTQIRQICLVTNDFEKTVYGLSKELGIGPFKCWDHKPPRLFDIKVYGKEVYFTMKLAIAWIGNTQLEVIQPLEGQNIYQEYFDTYKEGVQHLLLETGNLNLNKAVNRLATVDYSVIQEGKLNIPVQIGFLKLPSIPRIFSDLFIPRFAYLNTQNSAKTVLEILQLPPFLSAKAGISIVKPDYWIPAENTNINTSLSNSFIDQIYKIGIITHDLDKTVRNYVERLGIAPWKVYNLQSPRLSETKIHGKNVNLSVRIAVTYVGNTLLEIVQPLDGISIYHDLLDKHGEGVHYIGVASEKLNFSELIKHFNKLGYSIAMEGKLENAYHFAYLDTKSVAKMMIEVISIPVNQISVALENLQPDEIYPNLNKKEFRSHNSKLNSLQPMDK